MSSSNRYWDNYYQQRDRDNRILKPIKIEEVRSGKITITKSSSSSLKDKIANLFKDRL